MLLCPFSLVLLLSLSASLSSFSADLSIASASDLIPAQQALTDAFRSSHGHNIRWINGSSGLLARQIRHGAPYDLFLSADRNYAQQLESDGHAIPGSVRPYALGRLGLYARRPPAPSPADLVKPEYRYIAIANPAHAPYGRAAMEYLQRTGLHALIASKLVYAENVQQAFQMAATGNADVCIVAWSLVLDRGGVPLDSKSHSPIIQAAAIPRRTTQPAAARQFLEFLAGGQARAILTRFGFAIPGR
jgi:molybdate transport system substrate-binding protein